MIVVTKVFLLLLLSVGVHSDYGPTALTAEVDNSKGDYADIIVQWKPGDCPTRNFMLYIQASWENQPVVAQTNGTNFTFVDREFWTNYTILLDALDCSLPANLTSEIFTGPGNPHKIVSVETAPDIIVANVTIQEAFMARPVDQYNLTFCSVESCQTQMFTRNSQGPSELDLELVNLDPSTPYDLTIAPEISFEGKVFRGPEYPTKFFTKDIHLPTPSEINVDFPWDSINHQNVKVTWKLDTSPYEFVVFNINVTSPEDPTVQLLRNLTETETLFLNVPLNITMAARITAFFNVSGKLMHAPPGTIIFDAPDLDPGVSNFTYVNLNEKKIYAEWTPSLHLLPHAISFNFSYTNPKTNVTVWQSVDDPSISLDGLDLNTTYAVKVTVLSITDETMVYKLVSTDLESEFTTLAEDYKSPTDFEAMPVNQTSDKVSYNITWNSDPNPMKASKFQIKYCEQPRGECWLDHTSNTYIVLPFSYFSNCDIAVTAVYKLNLNKTQLRRGQKMNLQTPGTKLSEVTDVTVLNVTTKDAVLVWTAPENVQKGLTAFYKIFDAANNLINQTAVETFPLNNLSTYTFYEVYIQASVMYNNTEFSSNVTSFGFFSNSDTPGAPDSVDTEQIVRTNVFKVFWGEPRIPNGQLDYYEVLVSDAEGKMVSNLTNLVGTRSTTIALHSAQNDANYTVNVRAVNVNLQNETLPGNWTESTLLFKGIDPPTAEVIKRSSNSLTFKVTPSNTTSDLTGLFFSLSNGNNSFSDSSDQIEVKNLPAYTDVTVEARACYLPTFCSEAFSITRRTNVDGPSQVNNLRGDFTNITVPFINWTQPDVLNGPLNGYIVELTDLTNSSVKLSETLPANQTSYVYETDMEFEKYNFTVLGFNLDLDEQTNFYYGERLSTMVNTTGVHPPKPENVQELNKTSTSASFQWQKPLYPNFDVSYYLIKVPSLKIEEMTNETTFTLNGLKPWTTTNVLASGCESENSTSCGLPGSYDIVTSVDKPSEPLSITVTNVTRTEASVSWAAPTTPNGPITGYKIAVTESDNQNLTWNQVEEKAAVHKLANLTSGTKYTVHLLAYNVDDDTGEELASPASTADFTTESGGFAWWIVVVALIVIAAGAGVGVVFYRRRKMQGEGPSQGYSTLTE